jgi:MYXO-CTERM domain-containing protein
LLYSENFDREGNTGGAYDDGTSPETNVGNIGVLQSTGISQGGNSLDTAWSTTTSVGPGVNGLRFGSEGGYNWATGANSAIILAAGGFSISFDYAIPTNDSEWIGVRVGSGLENIAINAAGVTFGALARGNGAMETFDDGNGQGFGTEGLNATRSAQFNYAFTSWAAGTTVTFTGIIDGNTVATDTFTWDASDNMKIVLAGSVNGNLVDNIQVSTIPEPSAALLGGLGLFALLRRRRS